MANNVYESLDTETIVTAKQSVYVRQYPGKNNKPIKVVNEGDAIHYFGRTKTIENHEWIKVQVETESGTSVIGWSMAEFYDMGGAKTNENSNSFRQKGNQN